MPKPRSPTETSTYASAAQRALARTRNDADDDGAVSSLDAAPSAPMPARVVESDPSRASPTSAKRTSVPAVGGDTLAVNVTRSPERSCCTALGVTRSSQVAAGRSAAPASTAAGGASPQCAARRKIQGDVRRTREV